MKAQHIRFTDDDLKLFSSASHDRNSLHLSEEYARRTAFGEPVVFGVLGALATLSVLDRRAGATARRFVFEFNQAMFKEVSYRIEVRSASAEKTTLTLYDGSRAVLRGVVVFGAAGSGPPGWQPPRGVAPPSAEAADPAVLQPGVRVGGEYAPSADEFAAVLERFGLRDVPVSAQAVAALLCSSYLTGMVVPGDRALFSRLSIDLDLAAMPASGPILYEASVVARNPATSLLRTLFSLGSPELPWARGELRAFVRLSARERAGAQTVPAGAPPQGSSALARRVAFIVGGSRGLGAALASRLAAEGCTVIAAHRHGSEEVERLVGSLRSDAGKIVPLIGDGADPSFCAEAAARLRRDHGRLDFLFCNAAPSLRPLWLDLEAAGRIVDYIRQSVTVAAVPMMALLPLLESNGGWLVFSSTMFVRQPPPEFPHYVSAKLAVEGLIATAVAEYPHVTGLIVRYPRLLTDSGGHLSSAGSLLPEKAITTVLDRIMGSAAPGRHEVLEIA